MELWSVEGPILGYCVPEPDPTVSVLPAERHATAVENDGKMEENNDESHACNA